MVSGKPNTQVLMSDISNDSLEHYGVKGMKWGVRKDRQGKVTSVVKKTPFRGKNEYDGPNADGKSAAIKKYADPKVLTNLKKIYKDAYTPIKRGLKSINSSDKYKDADLTDSNSKVFKQYHSEVSSMVREKLDVSTTLKLRPGDRFVIDSYDYDTRTRPTPRLGTVSENADRRNTPQAKDYADGVKYRHNTDKDNLNDAVKQDALKHIAGSIALGPISTPVVLKFSSFPKAVERQQKSDAYNEFYKKRNIRHSGVEDEEVSDPQDFHLNFGFANNGFIEDVKMDVKSKSDANGEVKHFDLTQVVFSEAEDYLEHYGIKGMRWGVRRSRSAKAKEGREKGEKPKRRTSEEVARDKVKKAKRKAKTEVKIAKVQAKKERQINEANSQKTPINSKRPVPASQLTNQQLQDVITRNNLEKQYNAIAEASKPKSASEMITSYATKKLTKAGDQAVDRVIKNLVNTSVDSIIEGDKKKKKD